VHSDEKLWETLENSHLKQFVLGLEKKLEFECSEGGENLRYQIYIIREKF
jgi:ABC-type multidrug transport system fused ATPase/permease subunit